MQLHFTKPKYVKIFYNFGVFYTFNTIVLNLYNCIQKYLDNKKTKHY